MEQISILYVKNYIQTPKVIHIVSVRPTLIKDQVFLVVEEFEGLVSPLDLGLLVDKAESVPEGEHCYKLHLVEVFVDLDVLQDCDCVV